MRKKSLIGKTFGKLFVVSVSQNSKRQGKYICSCICGNSKEVERYLLLSGHITSCGCLRCKHNFIDLTGKKFGRLFVIKLASSRNRTTYYECECDCGNKTITCGQNLRSGKAQSCGCRNREIVSKMTHKHGKSGTSIYHIWNSMIQRCHNKNSNAYHFYGGRGIRVCQKWRKSFAAFYADVGERQSKEHQLDRINNNSDYKPGNVRWATRKEQMKNIRTNRFLTYRGQRKHISEWARIIGIRQNIISYRLDHANMSIEDAFNRPLKKYPNRYSLSKKFPASNSISK